MNDMHEEQRIIGAKCFLLRRMHTCVDENNTLNLDLVCLQLKKKLYRMNERFILSNVTSHCKAQHTDRWQINNKEPVGGLGHHNFQ